MEKLQGMQLNAAGLGARLRALPPGTLLFTKRQQGRLQGGKTGRQPQQQKKNNEQDGNHGRGG